MTSHLFLVALVSVSVAQTQSALQQQARLSTFVSQGQRSYLEIAGPSGMHKILTSEDGGFRVVFVLDRNDVPDVMALIDSAKKKAVVVEYRREQKIKAAGLRLLDSDYMRQFEGHPGYGQWHAKFAVFTVGASERTRTFKSSKQWVSRISVAADGGVIALKKPKEMDCACPATATCCVPSPCACAFRALCRAYNCGLEGDVGCVHDAMDEAAVCLTGNADLVTVDPVEGPVKPADLIPTEENGRYNLAR